MGGVSPAYEDLADQIAGQIRSGVYSPGDRLPSRSKLTQEGWGDQVAQDAMLLLVRRGLATSRPGAGYYVVGDPGPDFMRRLLAAEEQIAALRQRVTELEENSEDRAAFAEHDAREAAGDTSYTTMDEARRQLSQDQ